jgi:uncharacterized integral membrane protein
MTSESNEPESSGVTNAVLAKRIGLGLVVAYLVAFLLSNRDEVNVSFVAFDANTSLVVALLVTGVLGFVFGWSVSTMRHRRRRGRG